MTPFERALTFAAAIVTIGNFVVVFPAAVVESWVPLEVVSAMTVPTKLVIVTFLELALAHAFGRLFGLGSQLHELNKFLLYVLVAVLSAWLSVFNLESLLIGRVISGLAEHFGFAVMLVITWLVASIMIDGHVKLVSADDEASENVTTAVTIQGIAFLFIFISLMFR